MRGCHFLLTSVCVLVYSLLVPPVSGADAPPTDKARLQGTWKLVSGEVNGKPLSPTLVERRFRVVVSGEKWNQFMGDGLEPDRWSYSLDPSRNPKQIDLTDLSPDAKENEKTVEGIYQIDGDTLRICSRKPGIKGRPGEFKSADLNTMVRVYERVK